jgi:hypothetical protein
MKKTLFSTLATLAVVSAPIQGPALADQGVPDSNAGSAPALAITVNASYAKTGVAHVANGVALRNRTSGTIHLRGVPPSSTVVTAFLYWNFSDAATAGAATSPALFSGNLVTGTKTSDNPDPCWGLSGNHTYRADVTGSVPKTLPNQDYEVVLPFDGATTTSGLNPWVSGSSSRNAEGATLVIVYSNSNTKAGTTTAGKAVVIYDALSGSFFSTTLSATLPHPISLSGSGLYTMCGADGQRGGGHDNGASNETGFFNGIQKSGPPTAHSDWDGDTGLPLPQLWDVHTHVVALVNPSSVVSYTAGSDCLVPVFFILQGNTP